MPLLPLVSLLRVVEYGIVGRLVACPYSLLGLYASQKRELFFVRIQTSDAVHVPRCGLHSLKELYHLPYLIIRL